MKAVAIAQYLPIEDPDSFIDTDLPKPEPSGHDLLVAVQAVAINPVDTKVRGGRGKLGGRENPPRVIGWDASARVEARGYCRWPRVEEVMAFARQLGVEHLGIANCVGLIEEARLAGADAIVVALAKIRVAPCL